MVWAKKLEKNTKFLAWKTLIESKFNYATILLMKFSPSLIRTLETLQYRALKGLLNIGKMVPK